MNIDKIAELLAAYLRSDFGNDPAEKVWTDNSPNYKEAAVNKAKRWLAQELEPKFVLRNARGQLYYNNEKGSLKRPNWVVREKAHIFTSWNEANDFRSALPKVDQNWYVVDRLEEL